MHRIKAGYQENPGPRYFLDDVTFRRGTIFQPDVYTMAELLVPRASRAPIVVDVGCGWGEKLALLHDRQPRWDLFGVDFGSNIEHCRRTYGEGPARWGTWLDHDLETPLELPASCVVICSDVIEHLADPTVMLQSFSRLTTGAIIFSTPERDVQHGPAHAGPSPNECHVREWNGPELRALLEDHGLTVRWFGLTRSSDEGETMGTQIIVATP